MTYSRENNASNYGGSLPEKSPMVQQNEEQEGHNKNNPITISSSDSSKENGSMHGGDINSTRDMLMVNKVYSPIYTYLAGNMAATIPSHVHGMGTINADNSRSGAPVFNNFHSLQMAKNYSDTQDTSAAGVFPNSLGGKVTATSALLDDDDDSLKIAALLNDFHSPQVDQSMIHMGDNIAAGVQSNSYSDTSLGTSHAYEVNLDGGNALSLTNQFNNFQRPQVNRNFRIGGNSAAALHLNIHSGRGIGDSRIDGATVNCTEGTRFSAQLNNFQDPYNDRGSMNIGNDTAATRSMRMGGCNMMPTVGTSAGTTLVHHVTSNKDNTRNVVTQSNTFQNPRANRKSMRIGGGGTVGFQAKSWDGAANRMPQYVNGVTVDGNIAVGGVRTNISDKEVSATNPRSGELSLDGTYGSLNERNFVTAGGDMPKLQRFQIKERLMVGNNVLENEDQANTGPCTEQVNSLLNLGFGGDSATGVLANCQDKAVSVTNPRSTLSLDGIYGSLTKRNLVIGGGNMPELQQSQINGRLRDRNNVTANEGQVNAGPSTEQIDNSHLNLGVGGDCVAGFPSNVLGGGISNPIGWPVATQSYTSRRPPAVGLHSNVLGGGVPNNGWPIATQSHAFHRLPVDGSFLSLGGSMGNQIWSNNGNRTIFDTNGRVNTDSFSLSQTGDMHHHLARPRGDTVGIGGNRDVRYANVLPNSSSQGDFRVVSRPLNYIPTGFPANQQVRVSRVAPAPTNVMGIPNGSFPTQLQQVYLNSARSLPTHSPVLPPLTSVSRTFAQYGSGQHAPPDVAIAAQAAQEISDLSSRSRQAQTAQCIAHVSGKGRPVSDDVNATQAAKVIVDLSTKSKQAQTAKDKTPVSRRGKRGPAEGGHSAQSAKVLLGSSASGKPVPLAGHIGVAREAFGQPIQASNTPLALATLPHQKMTPQPSKTPSIPSAVPITAPEHIRWKGSSSTGSYSSGFSPSIGENCQLCKRDLSLSPTGPITQPSIPPPVAVLPCGHTFHDECLERITPPEESKNPPCIPCAIGTF